MKINDITYYLFESYKDAVEKFSQEESEEIVNKYLDTFKQLANKEIVTGQEKDIGYWIKQGWYDFKEFVDKKSEIPSQRDIKKKRVNKDKDSIVLYDDDNVTAILPLTKTSSCFYGKNTKWCTSVVSDKNRFNQYIASLRFPIYVFIKDKNESIAIVYSLMNNEIVEIRDSQNELINNHEIINSDEMRQAIKNLKQNSTKLKNISENLRTKEPYNALYYAVKSDKPFPEGENIISKDPSALAIYINKINPEPSKEINDGLIKYIKDGVHVSDSPFIESDGNIKSIMKVFKKYIENNFNDVLANVDNDELIDLKIDLSLIVHYLTKNSIILNIDNFEKMVIREKTDIDERIDDEEIIDIHGYKDIEESISYLNYIFNSGENITEYIEIIKKHYSTSFSFLISNYIIDLGADNEFVGEILNNVELTGKFILKILKEAINGEYIFKHVSFERFNAENMYKLLKIEPNIINVINSLPDELKQYIKDNDLKNPVDE